MSRVYVSKPSPYAPIGVFFRAVRVGNQVSIDGTAPIEQNGRTIGLDSPAAQTHQSIETIKAALEEAGASLNDVVRTKMLLTRINDWEQVAKVRGVYFSEFRLVDTVMQASQFINPD